jgi:hypothetical protein
MTGSTPEPPATESRAVAVEEVPGPRQGLRAFRLAVGVDAAAGGGARPGATVVALRGPYAVRVDVLGVDAAGRPVDAPFADLLGLAAEVATAALARLPPGAA